MVVYWIIDTPQAITLATLYHPRGGNMRTTALKIASLCVVLGLLLTACVSPAAPAQNAAPAQSGSTTPKNGGTLIAARAADAKGLDPHKQTAFSSFRVLELIYD